MSFNWNKIKRSIRLQLPPTFAYEAGPMLRSRPYEALPTVTPVVTYSFILISAVLFYFTDIQTGMDPQLQAQANDRFGERDNANVLLGHWWAIVGNAFFHGGFLHFFMNALMFIGFGSAVERGIGSLKTLALFIAFAAVSGGYQILITTYDLYQFDTEELGMHLFHYIRALSYSPNAPFLGGAVGLSGILFAIIGFMWGSWKRWTGFLEIFNLKTLKFIFFWQIACFVMSLSGTYPIANTAHISGLIIGFFVGMWMCYGVKNAKLWFCLTILMVLVLTAGLTFNSLHLQKITEPLLEMMKDYNVIKEVPLFQ